MTSEQQDSTNTRTRIWTATLGLGGFALLAALTVSFTEQETRERIDTNRRAYAMRMVTEVLTGANYNNAPSEDSVNLQSPEWLGTTAPLTAYRARRDSNSTAIAYTVVAPDGYVGEIRLLVGIDMQGRITRARVLEHRETPGLGDKIEAGKADWILMFDARQLNAGSWQLRGEGGELDHISGATITSRAVLNAIRRTLELHSQNAAGIAEAVNDSELRLQPR